MASKGRALRPATTKGSGAPGRGGASHRGAAAQDREAASFERAQELSAHALAKSRRSAAPLLVVSFEQSPRESLALLAELAADADRTVRSAASTAAARIARAHFERAHVGLAAWRGHESPHVRRALAGVIARAAEPHRLERAPVLLKLVDPLLADPNASVRRAVGPGTLGSLLRAYPEATFEALIGWSTSSDPHVLWNVAMAFASPSAAPLAKRGLIVLRKLALDERRAVWRAVAAATWQLGRRRPDVVRPELERWIEDEARAKVAREALRYL